MNLNKFKTWLLNESSAQTERNVPELLELIDSYGDKTLIFFDFEADGALEDESGISNLVAVAVDPRKWFEKSEVLDTFQGQPGKRLNELREGLESEMSKGKGQELFEEQDVLEDFEEFVQGFKSPVLVAGGISKKMEIFRHRKLTTLPSISILDTFHLFNTQIVPVLKTILQSNVDQGLKTHTNNILSRIKDKKESFLFGIHIENWETATNDINKLMEVIKGTADVLKNI